MKKILMIFLLMPLSSLSFEGGGVREWEYCGQRVSEATARHMMSYGVDLPTTPDPLLITMIGLGDEDTVSSLLNGGTNPNCTNRIGETALIYLLKPEYPHVEKQMGILKRLLAAGADPAIPTRRNALYILRVSLFNAHRLKLLEMIEDHLYLMREKKRKLE